MEKDKVMKCYEVIQDMRLVEMRSSLVSMAPQTPVGVLDVTCLSYTRIFLKKTMDEALQRRGSFNYSKSTKYGATWLAVAMKKKR
ncbi:hypothetical protein HPP92_006239 [Vanilla planifolia]|uniref:Uncharacterized protein n=1 Tax=Vanilla planifolia TaxID=51239 RepID=A0A835RMW3_VANPL|nr:hypothetical protein HPP92_006239 [Vanilla planifolia]